MLLSTSSGDGGMRIVDVVNWMLPSASDVHANGLLLDRVLENFVLLLLSIRFLDAGDIK